MIIGELDPQELRARGAAADREARDAVPGRLHHGLPAGDRACSTAARTACCASSASSPRRSCPARAPPRSSRVWCAARRCAGVLEEDTASLLDRSLTFARLSAADVMTPRPSIHALVGRRLAPTTSSSSPAAPATAASRSTTTSMDDIVGIVHLKQAVGVPRERRADVPAAALATEPLRVPEAVHLDTLVSELRGPRLPDGDRRRRVRRHRRRRHARGPRRGDRRRGARRARPPPRGHRPRATGSLTFPGDLRPDEVLDRTGIRVPEGDVYDTVGGYIMSVARSASRSSATTLEVEDGTLRVAAHGRPPGRPRPVHAHSDAGRGSPTEVSAHERLGRNRLAGRAAGLQRLLRRRRVRRHLRPPLADRAAAPRRARARPRPRCTRWSTRRSCWPPASWASRSARC